MFTDIDDVLQKIVGIANFVQLLQQKNVDALTECNKLPKGKDYTVFQAASTKLGDCDEIKSLVEDYSKMFGSTRARESISVSRSSLHIVMDSLLNEIDSLDVLSNTRITDGKGGQIVHGAPKLLGNANVNRALLRELLEPITDNFRECFKHPVFRNQSNGLLPVPGVLVISGVHPLSEEIESCRIRMRNAEVFDSKVKTLREVTLPKCTEQRNAVMIDTLTAWISLVEKLRCQNVIFIDLEHHDLYSYRGITCIMQLSTVDNDYIIDLLRPGMMASMSLFNVISANGDILKVFHGAHRDVQWLQRDMGVYLVNVFDTFHCSKVMNPGLGASLQDLVFRYVNIPVDKKHQLSDWRIRPLPKEMIEYARLDTFYLMHVFREMLITIDSYTDKDQSEKYIEDIIDRSSETSLILYNEYQQDFFNPSSIVSRRRFVPPHIEKTLSCVLMWRDCVARTDDVSSNIVLSDELAIRLCLEWEKNEPEPTLIDQNLDVLRFLEMNQTAQNRFGKLGNDRFNLTTNENVNYLRSHGERLMSVLRNLRISECPQTAFEMLRKGFESPRNDADVDERPLNNERSPHSRSPVAQPKGLSTQSAEVTDSSHSDTCSHIFTSLSIQLNPFNEVSEGVDLVACSHDSIGLETHNSSHETRIFKFPEKRVTRRNLDKCSVPAGTENGYYRREEENITRRKNESNGNHLSIGKIEGTSSNRLIDSLTHSLTPRILGTTTNTGQYSKNNDMDFIGISRRLLKEADPPGSSNRDKLSCVRILRRASPGSSKIKRKVLKTGRNDRRLCSTKRGTKNGDEVEIPSFRSIKIITKSDTV